jgi:hypothetical protein
MTTKQTCEKCGSTLDARCPFCSDGYEYQFNDSNKGLTKIVCRFCNGTNRVSHQSILDYRRGLVRYIDGCGEWREGEDGR